MMADRQAIYAHIDRDLPLHVAAIQRLVQQPSVSLEGSGLHECALVLAANMASAGCNDVAVVDLGDGYPGVWGCVDCGKPSTLFIYGHFDVRPVGTEPWSHPPFSGEVIPFGGFPKVLFGRGAAGQKGPLQAWINAMASILAVEDELPVNLVFLIEGAELLGSPNYKKMFALYHDRLAKASALYGPKTGQDVSGSVNLVLGYKGLISLELTASTAASGRGPLGGAVHSATNVVADSPVWRLCHALASLADPLGRNIKIPALRAIMEAMKPIEPWERPLLDAMRASVEGRDPNTVIPGLARQFPVSMFKYDEPTADLLQRYMYGGSFNINGLRSGYTGPGTKSFLLPHTATATCDIRVISDIGADEIVAMVRGYLDESGFPDVVLNARGAYDWGQTSDQSNLIQAMLKTLDVWSIERTLWPMQAFGGPWAHCAKHLGIPSLQGGSPGHGAGIATSDEFLVIESDGKVAGLAEIERFFVDLLYQFAKDAALQPGSD